ncbi:MAG TPA: hypothetical protein VM053_05940 [Gemmatimonadaceae bacterium]|nr:hypothetical protein [Gemmatimonadaceae bacterium]
MIIHPPFVAPGSTPSPVSVHSATLPSIQEFLDDLPSIEEFVDDRPVELPPIADFVADGFRAEAPRQTRDGDWFEQEEHDADGWAVAGWQDFDWTGAARLGARSQITDEANSAWDTLDWSDVPVRTPQSTNRVDTASPSADEVARALDGIAQRIRSGELVLDQLSETQPEAAMAAALATLMRMRD